MQVPLPAPTPDATCPCYSLPHTLPGSQGWDDHNYESHATPQQCSLRAQSVHLPLMSGTRNPRVGGEEERGYSRKRWQEVGNIN